MRKTRGTACSLIESDEGTAKLRHRCNTSKQRIKAGTDHLHCDIYCDTGRDESRREYAGIGHGMDFQNVQRNHQYTITAGTGSAQAH